MENNAIDKAMTLRGGNANLLLECHVLISGTLA